MPLQKYIEEQYIKACDMQREIAKDQQMIDMLRADGHDAVLVKSWMRDYGLLQGINTLQRDAIAETFLNYVKGIGKTPKRITEQAIERYYMDLFLALYAEVPRSWMSATSKLLWCIFPYDLVIYDSFVHRALTVMQRVDGNLKKLPRLGAVPKVSGSRDIESAVVYYIRYQKMIKCIHRDSENILKSLREKSNESYKYDIRIIDKILWMLGSPSETH